MLFGFNWLESHGLQILAASILSFLNLLAKRPREGLQRKSFVRHEQKLQRKARPEGARPNYLQKNITFKMRSFVKHTELHS